MYLYHKFYLGDLYQRRETVLLKQNKIEKRSKIRHKTFDNIFNYALKKVEIYHNLNLYL